MKISAIIKRSACVACALTIALTCAACGCSKKEKKAASNVGHLTSDGYELPYEYSDGYVAVAKVVDDSEYETVSTSPNGSMVFHLTTSKTEDEVKKFYDDYFKNLQEVKAKKETDHSVGYYDPEKRLIVYNLVVWKANGVTNYKFGAEACDDLKDNETWEVGTSSKAEATTKAGTEPASKPEAATKANAEAATKPAAEATQATKK